MKYYGYVLIPHESYFQWKSNVNGNGYDFDSTYGCQCYDLAVEFWWNVGFPTGYPVITNSSAYTMWTNRTQNIAYDGTTYFDLVYNLEDIKQGDVMVFDQFSGNPYGHVGFADVDYNNWTPDPNQPYEFPILSENNGGTPDPAGGAYTNVHGYDIRLFLGAFRYREWNPIPPSPGISKKHFPWVLRARKLNQMRNHM